MALIHAVHGWVEINITFGWKCIEITDYKEKEMEENENKASHERECGFLHLMISQV